MSNIRRPESAFSRPPAPADAAASRLPVAIGLLVALLRAGSAGAQPPPRAPSSHIVITALASVSQPSSLDYEAAECDVSPDDRAMECVFQQVFLTVSLLDARTCLIATNRYGRTFQRENAARWVSREPVEGACPAVATSTLEHDARGRWTLENRTVVTSREADPSCRTVDDTAETLSWQNVRRTLPCTFVQPGAMSW